MNFKKLFGLSVFFGSLAKLLFFTKKPPKLHKNVPDYTRQPSDKDYVDVDVTEKQPNFTHPNSSSNDDNVIRSPDGSA